MSLLYKNQEHIPPSPPAKSTRFFLVLFAVMETSEEGFERERRRKAEKLASGKFLVADRSFL